MHVHSYCFANETFSFVPLSIVVVIIVVCLSSLLLQNLVEANVEVIMN